MTRHTELGVESGQEVRQQDVGLLQGAGSRQPEFTDQAVLEGAQGLLIVGQQSDEG